MPTALSERDDPLRPAYSPEPNGPDEHRAPEIDDLVNHLMLEFEGLLPADRVRHVVVIGRRDLVGEVPAEALPEFLHRLARQRLTDVRSIDDVVIALDGSRA